MKKLTLLALAAMMLACAPKQEQTNYPQADSYCQSCGMPLTEEVMGTNADGSLNEEYCSYCYQNGAYTFECTMDEMIDRCAEYVNLFNESTKQNLSQEEYKQMLRQYFPTLKRWKSTD